MANDVDIKFTQDQINAAAHSGVEEILRHWTTRYEKCKQQIEWHLKAIDAARSEQLQCAVMVAGLEAAIENVREVMPYTPEPSDDEGEENDEKEKEDGHEASHGE